MQEWNPLLLLVVIISIFFAVIGIIRHNSWETASDAHLEEWNKILEGKGRFRRCIEMEKENKGDEDYEGLSDKLIDYDEMGEKKYYGNARKQNNKKISNDSFFGRNKLDVKAYNLGKLKNDLKRDKKVKRSIFTIFNYVVIAFGVILLFILLPPVIYPPWRPKFDDCYCKGQGCLFLVICVIYLLLLLAGIGLCILITTSDLNDRKGKLSRGLKTVAAQIKTFNEEHPDAITNPWGSWDTVEGRFVKLSPLSWFLIILECLMGGEGLEIDEALSQSNIPSNRDHLKPILNLAKARIKKNQPIVQINQTPRSYEWLNQLLFCPDNPSYRILAFELVGLIPRCLLPFLAFLFVWYEYYEKGRAEKELAAAIIAAAEIRAANEAAEAAALQAVEAAREAAQKKNRRSRRFSREVRRVEPEPPRQDESGALAEFFN